MRKTWKSLLCLVLVVLLAAAALTLTGCKQQGKHAAEAPASGTEAPKTETPETEAPATDAPETEAPATEATETEYEPNEGAPVPVELGEGTKSFYFEVTHADGAYELYEIHTDADTVGEALTGEALIEGEESQYGLYVKTVCGETLDYDLDGYYWAFYVNSEYAMTGVDATAIEEGATYSFAAEAG